MAESVSYIFWLGTFIYALFTGNYSLAAVIFGLDLAITMSIALYQGWKLDYDLSEIVKSVPAYYLMRVPSMLMFWFTFIMPKSFGW
jgi:hypothetical protein